MIAMSFRTFTTKVLVFILSNLLSTKIRGRHSTTEVPRKLYQTFVFSTMENDNKIVNLEKHTSILSKQYVCKIRRERNITYNISIFR